MEDFDDYVARMLLEQRHEEKFQARQPLRQAARELIVHPTWQPFVDEWQDLLNRIKRMISIGQSRFGRPDVVGDELLKVRLDLLYQQGMQDMLAGILKLVKELSEKGDEDASTGRP